MKHKRHHPLWHKLAVLVALSASFSVKGQVSARMRPIEDPQPLKVHVNELSSGLYAEGRFEETSVDDSVSTHDRYFVGPLLGLSANGSVYHPNLFSYIINSEGAFGWATDELKSGNTVVRREEFEYLGRFSGNATVFGNRPYRANLFGDYDHSYRDYDFFNRVVVDSTRYGAKIGYDQGPVPVSAGYTHLNEDTSGFAGGTTTEQDIVTLNAHNERERGSSTLGYTYDQYSRNDFGRLGEGNSHIVTLADSERLGARDQMRLYSSASYSRRDDFEKSDEFVGALSLSAEHAHRLSSLYDFNFDNYQTEAFDSSSYLGRAELRHQLYDSLSSAVFLQGSDFEGSDNFGSSTTRRYGAGLAEGYTKRVGGERRLRLSNSVFVEHVDQDVGGGGLSTIENERHSFSEGAGADRFFLNLPNVITSTIVVTDQSDSSPAYVRGLDYTIIQLGERVIISRPAGSRIGATDAVLVDYHVTPTGGGNYDVLNDYAMFRLDLYKNIWGVYSRVNLSRNNADTRLRVPNILAYSFGTDVSWRWLRSGAEYEVYDSDLSKYNATRVFESASFNIDDTSSLSLDFSQAWIDYVDANRNEEDYRFVTRYHQNLTSNLRFDIEGGIDLRRGRDVDQTLATVRPGIEWSSGKLSIKAGYDFEYDLYLDREERTRHLFFFRCKRVF